MRCALVLTACLAAGCGSSTPRLITGVGGSTGGGGSTGDGGSTGGGGSTGAGTGGASVVDAGTDAPIHPPADGG
ncbi:MAG TPA: hypothetical protein VFH68_21445, partial [Polyangia bacterium]|nr:hypothetical protein [Polyangia bacterium]